MNPFDFESVKKFFGEMNKRIYGVNPYEKRGNVADDWDEYESRVENGLGEWNHDNYPPHGNEDRFNKKYGL